MQRHSLPREGKRSQSPLTGQHHSMQRRIQQHRVHTEPAHLNASILRNRDLGEQLLTTTPHHLQTLKRRAILIPPLRHLPIDINDFHRLRPHRRPHRHIRHIRQLRRRAAQHPLGMQRPLRLGVPTTRIHRHRPTANILDSTDDDPHLHHALSRHHQRSLQHQLLNNTAPNLITGTDHQLHKPSTREQHHPSHRMISQPRLRTHRQPASQHHNTGIRLLNHRTQHRMLNPSQTEPARITGPPRSRQPKPAPLKRIRRQRHPPGTEPSNTAAQSTPPPTAHS